LEKNESDISLAIRFLFDEELINDPKMKALQAFLANNSRIDCRDDAMNALSVRQLVKLRNRERMKMLEDWYEWKDYDKFSFNYPAEEINNATTISRLREWFGSTSISYVPTLFINGYPLPPYYDIGDLMQFLPMITQHFKIESGGQKTLV
jgi:hypothetical protein